MNYRNYKNYSVCPPAVAVAMPVSQDASPRLIPLIIDYLTSDSTWGFLTIAGPPTPCVGEVMGLKQHRPRGGTAGPVRIILRISIRPRI